MTADQIRKSIQIKSKPGDNNTVIFTAWLPNVASITVCEEELKHLRDGEIDERLRAHIMRDLSEDRGIELYHALKEYASINPMEFERLHEAGKKLMTLAHYQPPKAEAKT